VVPGPETSASEKEDKADVCIAISARNCRKKLIVERNLDKQVSFVVGVLLRA
jgi:hypothetical protein